MIIDLRGNIGGDLTFPQYLLGLFIGDNQYAFDLYHQGNYETQRTVVAQFAELEKYGELAILTDNMTQSTAELTTAVFKGRRLAYVVGATTRGWGSVENTYPLKTIIDPTQTYSLLLVNSLTLRDDNQPIESNGVVPNVNISDKNWKQELSNYFHSSSLIGAIEQTVTQPPLK
jgi:C-terminal processing protease CtpA/Prc